MRSVSLGPSSAGLSLAGGTPFIALWQLASSVGVRSCPGRHGWHSRFCLFSMGGRREVPRPLYQMTGTYWRCVVLSLVWLFLVAAGTLFVCYEN